MNDTNTFIKPLNDTSVVFIVGGSPTVTFNENVTVYSYPNQTMIDYIEDENTQIQNNKIQNNQIHNMQIQRTQTRKTKSQNIFKKLVSKFSKFRI